MLLLEIVAVFLASTVVFDVVHFLLHVFSGSRSALLRRIGSLHATHHAFLDRKLEIHDEFLRANLIRHVIPEFLTQASFSLALLWVLPPAPVLGALALQVFVFLMILATRGKDVNHRPIRVLRAYRPTFFCLPQYHALHHVWPDAHFSSWIKAFDHLARTGVSLRDRRIVLTGAETPFGAVLRDLLAKSAAAEVASLEPGRDFDPATLAGLEPALADADILVLAHDRGAQPEGPGGDSYVAAIELFERVARGRQLPAEVWALGARDAAAKRAFDRHSRGYYVDDRIIYRHIAPTGRFCRSGRDGAAAARAARVAFAFVRKGFNFVPTSAGGAAALEFVRFLLSRPARSSA